MGKTSKSTNEQKAVSQINGKELDYEQKHRPSSEFNTQDEYLEHEHCINALKQ